MAGGARPISARLSELLPTHRNSNRRPLVEVVAPSCHTDCGPICTAAAAAAVGRDRRSVARAHGRRVADVAVTGVRAIGGGTAAPRGGAAGRVDAARLVSRRGAGLSAVRLGGRARGVATAGARSRCSSDTDRPRRVDAATDAAAATRYTRRTIGHCTSVHTNRLEARIAGGGGGRWGEHRANRTGLATPLGGGGGTCPEAGVA